MDLIEPVYNLSISAISFVFSQISELNSKVSWIRSPDYEKQIYVSPSYEKIWGHKTDKLYEHPLSWNDTLVNTEVIAQLKNRIPQSNTTLHFQIHDAQNNVRFMKDTCFHLFDASGDLIAVGGVSEEITEKQWDEEIRIIRPKDEREDSVIHLLTQITKHSPPRIKEPSSKTQPINLSKDKFTKFTPRELACLKYLSTGQTAKQIARSMLISPRTVEAHIENMKIKLGCHTRLELISKISKFDLIH